MNFALMKVQLLKGELNGHNVLFKNLIGTLRNCALFFLGLSLVEVRVTGPVDGLLVGDVKTFRTKYQRRFQDLFSEWLHQIEWAWQERMGTELMFFLSFPFPVPSLRGNRRQTTLQIPGSMQRGSSCPLNMQLLRGVQEWGAQWRSRNGTLLQVNLLLRNHRFAIINTYKRIKRFHSHNQQSCKFIVTKESVYTRKVFNSHRISFGHQLGHRFIALGQQYGCCDVTWKHFIFFLWTSLSQKTIALRYLITLKQSDWVINSSSKRRVFEERLSPRRFVYSVPKKHGIPSLIHTLVTTRTISKRFFLIKWKTI